MNSALEAVLDKIRKLRALGESDNPHEAALAMAHAQRLMLKHQITEAVIAIDGGVESVANEKITSDHSPLWGGRQAQTWLDRLAMALCKAHGCSAYSNPVYETDAQGHRRGRQQYVYLRVVGRASDVNVARYLLDYCRTEVERLECAAVDKERHFRDPETGQVLFTRPAPSKTWRNNFKHGVVDAILKAVAREREELLAEMRAAAGANTRALVAVDSAVDRIRERHEEARLWGKTVLGLRVVSSSKARGDAQARAAGREAGRGVYEGARGARPRVGAGSKRLGSG